MMAKRLLLPLLICLLAGVPFLSCLIDGGIFGAGPDVVSTLWGMWWFQQEGIAAISGVDSELLNYPYGAKGTILSPSSALLWSAMEPVFGVGPALIFASLMQIWMLCLGCFLLARRASFEFYACLVAGAIPLVGTYLFFGVGEGSLVAIAAAPMVFGLYAILQMETEQWRYAFLGAFCMIWMALENPYLAPVLPGLCGCFWLQRRKGRPMVVLSLLLGSIGILYIASVFGASANPDYPREVAGQQVRLLGRVWDIVELPWARMSGTEFFWPRSVRWTTDAVTATEAAGGRYLGLSVVLLSLYAVWKEPKSRPWFGFAVIGLLLSVGSLFHGLAFPFLFLNGVMDSVARPLTQPTRYLCLSVVGFALCCAYATSYLQQRNARAPWIIGGVLLMDAFLFGGLSLNAPITALPK
ncbi:MAG: hypothetical protein VX278_22125 [Myxococcota bacterium]|nr:hypothetical protein [Myxococcota bacterium]